MDREKIKDLADSFFEWPTEDKKQVTTTSAILFADFVSKKAQEKIDTLEKVVLRYITKERRVRNNLDEFGSHKTDCLSLSTAYGFNCDCGYSAIEKENSEWFGRDDDC